MRRVFRTGRRREVRSCVTPASMAVGKEVTTLEGLPARWAAQKHLGQNQATQNQAKAALHPVQVAWIKEQVPLCGFCQSGMMIKATELLEHKPNPTDAEISEAFTTGGVATAVPLRNLYRDQRCSTPCLEAHGRGRGLMEHLREAYEQMTDVCGARLSRRSFVKSGGALVVGFGFFRGRTRRAAAIINGDAFDVSLPPRGSRSGPTIPSCFAPARATSARGPSTRPTARLSPMSWICHSKPSQL